MGDRSKQVRVGHPWPTRRPVTAVNLGLPAGGIRRPHPRPDIGGARVREPLVVIGHDRRFDRKHMIKNRRIPRYKPIIPDSEVSDGTRPACADSEARAERFLQKRNFSDRADINLYFPILTFGRGYSYASRRFVTRGIEIYNQIKGLSILRVKNRIALHIFPILTFGRGYSDASRRFVTWGIEIYNQIKGLSILRVKTIEQIRKQGGARPITSHCRRAAFAALTRVLTSVGRGCGSAWSLSASHRRGSIKRYD